MHRIDGGETLDAYAASTKASTNGKMIHALRDLGIASTKAWLLKRYKSLGMQSTVNIKRDYLDDLRVPVN
jgi:NTE family protein